MTAETTETAATNETTEAPPAPKTPSESGRDKRGRFAPGNPGGPGRPSGYRSVEYRAAIRGAVQPDHFRLIFQRLLQMAVKDGDVGAARLLTERCLGPLSHDPLGEGYSIDVPEVRSFADILKLTETLARAATTGKVPMEVAEKVFGLVSAVRGVYMTEVLHERLQQVEEHVRTAKGTDHDT